MTIRVETNEFEGGALRKESQETHAVGSAAFDWIMIAVCSWLVAGMYADAWAHNHLPIDNFFTPWHGLLYSGLLAVAIFLVGSFIRDRLRGYSWSQAMPAGYGLSLLGIGLFFLSGIGDLLWHIFFGIEKNLDAALSPTHLGIVISSVLVVSGSFRAAWKRSDVGKTTRFLPFLPVLLSLTYTLAVMTVISQFAHPFVFTTASDPQQDPFGTQALAVVSIAIQTVLLMGLVLLTIRRWILPFGALTLLFTLNVTLLSFMQDHYILIIAAALAGLIADVLFWWLKPSAVRQHALRLFAFAVPIVLYLLYFLVLQLTTGVNWTIHMWLGTTFVAGITGFLLSYLLVPPQIPVEKAE